MSVPSRRVGSEYEVGVSQHTKPRYHGLPTNKRKVVDHNQQQGVTDTVPQQMC